jgi:DNA-binding CsgD family transcriptional regulator
MIAVAPHASVFRRDRDLYANRLQQLAPHLVRAVEINRQLAATVRIEQALGRSLDALGTAAFVLAPNGRLSHANHLGDEMLRSADVIALKRDRTLAARDAAELAALDTAIRTAAMSGDGIGAPLRLHSRKDGATYLAWVFAMREPADPSIRANPLRLLDALDREGAILLLVTRTDRTAKVSADLLRPAFGLSVSEALLAEALVAGSTLAEYGAEKGLSRNTLRNQLASIFDKTGTNRQAELVARLLAVVGPFAQGR